MSDNVRWGILSTAKIGRERVVPALKESKNGVVTAVASRDKERAQTFADLLDIPTVYGSYEELLADPNIDAIYNPLPNGMHAEWAIKCAAAGKPMLCEKPFASDAAEAQTMVDAFAKRNLLFAEAFMYRFHPQTVKVLDMIANGAVGEVKVVSASFSFTIGEDYSNIRLVKDLAGGAMMDIGTYCISALRLMTGEEPDRVEAVVRMGEKSQVDETASGVLSFPSGAVGHFDCSFRAQHNHKYEIRGPEGRILVPECFVMRPDKPTKIHYWYGFDGYEEIVIPPANSYKLMSEDFADALLNNRPPRYLPQDAVKNMAVIDQVYAAAKK